MQTNLFDMCYCSVTHVYYKYLKKQYFALPSSNKQNNTSMFYQENYSNQQDSIMINFED